MPVCVTLLMRLFHFDYHFCVWAAEIRRAISGRQTEEHASDNWLIMSPQSGFLHWYHNIIHTLGTVLYSGLFTMCRAKSPPSTYALRKLCISWANSKICLTQKLYANSVIRQHLERQYTNACNCFVPHKTIQLTGEMCFFFSHWSIGPLGAGKCH